MQNTTTTFDRLGEEREGAPAATARIRQWIFVATIAAGLTCLQYAAPPGAEDDDYNPTLSQQVERYEQGNRLRQAALLLLGLAGTAGIVASRRRFAWPDGLEPRVPGLLLVFATYTLLSTTWADDPALGFKRWTAAGLLALGALGTRHVLGANGTVRFVFYVTLVQALGGVAWEVAAGSASPFAAEFRLSGGLHPNSQAIVVVLLFASATVVWKVSRGIVERRLAAGAVPLAAALLIATRSRTAFAGLLLAGTTVAILSSPSIRKKALLVALVVLAALVVLVSPVVMSSVTSVALLGRDTETERSHLWRECLEYVSERPVLGYGFGAFWTPDRVEEVAAVEHWGVAEAHSLYLELLLDGGVVGSLLGLLLLCAALFASYASWRHTRSPVHALAIATVLFVVLHGINESTLVRPGLLTFFAVAILAPAGAGSRVPERRAVRFRPGSLSPFGARSWVVR